MPEERAPDAVAYELLKCARETLSRQVEALLSRGEDVTEYVYVVLNGAIPPGVDALVAQIERSGLSTEDATTEADRRIDAAAKEGSVPLVVVTYRTRDVAAMFDETMAPWFGVALPPDRLRVIVVNGLRVDPYLCDRKWNVPAAHDAKLN